MFLPYDKFSTLLDRYLELKRLVQVKHGWNYEQAEAAREELDEYLETIIQAIRALQKRQDQA